MDGLCEGVNNLNQNDEFDTSSAPEDMNDQTKPMIDPVENFL